MGGDDGARDVTVVLVAIDAVAAARPLAALLDGNGFALLAVAGDPAGAQQLVRTCRPHVVVIDLDHSRDAAITAVGELTRSAPEVPVLAVSAVAEHAVVLAAVQAGAAGFVVRAAGVVDLVEAVRQVGEGGTAFTPGLAAVVLESTVAPTAPPGAGPARLTDREAFVVRLVVDGLTARQIATRLVISPRTVENHVQHVLRKLGLNNRAALVRYAIENGLA
jgi:DNA-binding NarL/FixJ family response regulator